MLAPGDVYELAVAQTYTNQVFINVWHFVLIGSTLTSPQTKFQTLADAVKEVFRPLQQQTLTYTGWKATQVSGAGISYSTTTCRRSGGDVYEGTPTGTLIGGDVSSNPMPTYNALVVALKTGLAGRSKRGQVFPGGYDNGKLSTTDHNQWAAAHVTAVQTAVNAFLTIYKQVGGTDPNFAWVVWSKFIASGCKYVPAVPKPIYSHVQPGDMPNSYFGVTSATPRALIAPMRRRKEGRGI